MSSDLQTTLIILFICIVMFAINKPRMDVVAIIILIVLPLSGIVTVNEALAGFGDPNVILIACLFVVGDGLVRTGIANKVGDALAALSGKSETRLVIYLMLAVASLGSVMSSTGVVAIFLPIILNLASRLKMHPARFMMPLSFAALISGMLTLVATPPNLILDGALESAGYAGFSFFSFLPVGLIVLMLGVGYMLAVGPVLTRKPDEDQSAARRRRIPHLAESYQLGGRGHSFQVSAGSPLIGNSLAELNLRKNYCANVVAIYRHGHIHDELLAPHSHSRIKTNDVLLIDIQAPEKNLHRLQNDFRLTHNQIQGSYFSEHSSGVGMAEIMISSESALLGKSITDAKFRKRTNLNVVGMRRGNLAMNGDFLETKLQVGDILLVAGPWKFIRRLQAFPHHFVVLTLPAEIDTAAPAFLEARYAIFALIAMVIMMVTGIVPNVLAVMITCLLMGAFRCVDMNSAYRSIHWQSLMVIIGMMPFSLALQKTGGLELATNFIMDFQDRFNNPRLVVALLFLITSVFSLFISNTATAVLLAPLAVSLAKVCNISPQPLAMTIALAASASFITPISSPVNLLVMGPGGYRFKDYVKIGLPFTLIVLIVTVTLVPVFFPF